MKAAIYARVSSERQDVDLSRHSYTLYEITLTKMAIMWSESLWMKRRAARPLTVRPSGI